MKIFLNICLSWTLISISNAVKDNVLEMQYMRNPKGEFVPRPDWMSRVRDKVKLCELAIPGTQGSASYDGNESGSTLTRSLVTSMPFPFSFFVKMVLSDKKLNQILNLKQQLHYGIRILEIKVLYANDQFGLVHGGRFLNLLFEEFLNIVADFLAVNPTETVLFTLKLEEEFGENQKSASAKLDDYLHHPRMSSYYLDTNDPDITMKEARGKFIILSQSDAFNDYGLYIYSSDFSVMDVSLLEPSKTVYRKWDLVKKHLNKAKKGNSDMFYVTYLSGFEKPPFIVTNSKAHPTQEKSVPKLAPTVNEPVWYRLFKDFNKQGIFGSVNSIAFEGTNSLARKKIQKYNQHIQDQSRTVGILMTDFIGDSLIESILQNNALLYEEE